MTQPPSPGDIARVDQAYADASRFIDQMLITARAGVQAGVPVERIYTQVGAGLHEHEGRGELTPIHLEVLVSIAVTRLAGLHHAVEQLADQQDAIAAKYTTDHQSDVGNGMAAAFRLVSAELRKLVADHG